jgi:hypothetical protein
MARHDDQRVDPESIWAAVTILGGFFPDKERARMDFLLLAEKEFTLSRMDSPSWFAGLKSRAASELRR